MSLKDTVTSMETHLTDAYNTLEEKGATLPENKNLENLPAAIESVSGGGDTEFGEATVELWLSGSSTRKSRLVGFTQAQLTGMVSALAVPNKASFDCGSVTQSSTSTPKSDLIKVRLVGNIGNRDYILGTTNTSYSFNNLKEIILEETTTIGSYFGATSSSLNKVSLPDTLTTIGTYFLSNCASLKYLTLPSSLSSIGAQFMYECKLLQRLYIPANVTPPTDNNSLSTNNASSPSYVNGITLYGPGAQAWINALPNRTTSPYRKLIYGGENEPQPVLINLKNALDGGTAKEDFPVASEIPDTWNGDDNPLIVAQYGTGLVNGETVEGVYLVRKFVEPISQQFGDNADYSTSAIKNFLDTTYYSKCSDALKSIITDVNIPYYNTTVKSKMFLMSDTEVCAAGHDNITEGIMWDYWKQKTGYSSPNNADTVGRIMKDRNGATQRVWLRSRYNTTGEVCFVNSIGAVSSATPASNSLGVLPACFIAKD